MAKRENSNLELRVAEESIAPHLERRELPHFPEWLLIVAKRKSLILKFVAGSVLSFVCFGVAWTTYAVRPFKIFSPLDFRSNFWSSSAMGNLN